MTIDKKLENIEELKSQQLYKEDFDLTCYAECNCDGEGCGYGLIDNSLYDKLPSKFEQAWDEYAEQLGVEEI